MANPVLVLETPAGTRIPATWLVMVCRRKGRGASTSRFRTEEIREGKLLDVGEPRRGRFRVGDPGRWRLQELAATEQELRTGNPGKEASLSCLGL